MKKILTLAIGLLLVGLAFSAAQEKAETQAQVKAQVKAQEKTQEKAQSRVQTRSELRNRFGTLFIDENGDGINDAARDADGDGIPNCQDPDWTRPLDGSGYKNQNQTGRAGTVTAVTEAAAKAMLARDDDGDGIPNGQDPDWSRPLDGSGYKDQHRIGRDGAKAAKAGFGKASFRQGATAAGRASGAGVCDGAGPKGVAQRKGRG